MTAQRKSHNKKSQSKKPVNFRNSVSEVLPISQEVLIQLIHLELTNQFTPSNNPESYNDCENCLLTNQCLSCPYFLEYDTPEHLDMNIGIFIATYLHGGIP